jgi:hypothetical protein
MSSIGQSQMDSSRPAEARFELDAESPDSRGEPVSQ